MKRNADRDLVEFSIETKIKNEESIIDGNVKEIGTPSGITCDSCNAYGRKMSDIMIGTSLCLHCKYCYGAKLRHHVDGNFTKVDGYVKCSKNNRSFVNKLRCILWKISGCYPIIKNLNNN